MYPVQYLYGLDFGAQRLDPRLTMTGSGNTPRAVEFKRFLSGGVRTWLTDYCAGTKAHVAQMS